MVNIRLVAHEVDSSAQLASRPSSVSGLNIRDISLCEFHYYIN